MPTSLEASGRWAGAHQWAESRLFEVLGGWAADTPEPEVRIMLDRHSQHAAWRAAQWWDRLPVLADVDRRALCVAGSDRVAKMAAALPGLEGTAARLAGAYRVALPRIFAAYRRHSAEAAEPSDGSAVRTLCIVCADLTGDWQEGEVRLQKLIVDGATAGVAAATVAALEEHLATGEE